MGLMLRGGSFIGDGWGGKNISLVGGVQVNLGVWEVDWMAWGVSIKILHGISGLGWRYVVIMKTWTYEASNHIR